MLKFLTKKAKKQIRREYFLRLINVFLMLVLIVIAFWTVALLPTYISLTTDKSVLQQQIDAISGGTKGGGKVEFSALKNSFMKKQSSLSSDQIEMNEYIKLIQEALPSSTYLEKIAIKKVEAKDYRTIELKGVSPDRDSLTIFADRLEKKIEFRGVDFPFSLFAKGQNIPFTLQFEALISQ